MQQSSSASFDREHWQKVLEQIALALGKEGAPVELCLIGSAACILGGMAGRTSMDLDVWQPASDYDLLELRRAVENAGLLFDPKSNLTDEQSYIQIVNPGIVQTGEFTSVLIQRVGRLRITRPPFENIIASKLVRASIKDIQDIQYMMQNYRPDPKVIKNIISSFHGSDRELAMENLIYLEVFGA